MLDIIREWVLNIVTFVIFIILLDIVVPSEKIKKFIRLVTGIILVIIIITPVLNIFSSGMDINNLQISDGNFLDRREIQRNSDIFEKQQLEQVIEVYRNKINFQLEDTTCKIDGISNVKADVIINEDVESDDFGRVKSVYLNVELADESSDVKPVIIVKKIVIGDDTDQQNEGSKIDSKLKTEIEDGVNKLLDVNKDSIVISVKKD